MQSINADGGFVSKGSSIYLMNTHQDLEGENTTGRCVDVKDGATYWHGDIC